MTRGQPAALAAVRSMVVGNPPHAVLLVGPAASGKTTLAYDLAAGLLCVDPDPSRRPCRACRGCRQVATGNHPDLHSLVPEGAGGQIRIGSPSNPEPGTIRRLVSELALLPVEGGARVAIVEAAHRINEEAQNALLKTLEEPPSGVTIVLCADDEERLLPTVRSRCRRVRLGTVAAREIEEWLVERGAAEAPDASRAARLSRGRPGLALAYVLSPDAIRIRDELARGLIDLLRADRRIRLVTGREMLTAAARLNAALVEGRARVGGGSRPDAEDDAGPIAGKEPRKRGRARAGSAEAKEPSGPSAADRRASASTLLDIWAAVARDLALAARGARRQLADLDLLEDTVPAAEGLDPVALTSFLGRLGETASQLDENVNPELAIDVLALAWPRPVDSASDERLSRPAVRGVGPAPEAMRG